MQDGDALGKIAGTIANLGIDVLERGVNDVLIDNLNRVLGVPSESGVESWASLLEGALTPYLGYAFPA